MNITLNTTDELNTELTLFISKEDYKQNVENSLKDIRKKTNLKGFRQGNVPISLIKKMYGRSAFGEEITKIINTSLEEYIKNEDIKMFGQPLQSETKKTTIDFKNYTDLEFHYDIALYPTISADYSLIEVPYYNIVINENIVKNQIDAYSEKFGKYNEAEKVNDNSTVKGVLTQLNANNEILDDGISVNDALIYTKFIKDKDIKKLFIDKIIDDSIDFDVKKAFPNDTEVASLLKIKKEDIAKLNPNFRIELKEIKEFAKSDLNQELFDNVFGKETVSSEEEFNNKVKEQLVEHYNRESDLKYKFDIQKKLVESIEFKLPDAFLKRLLIQGNENITENNIEEEYTKIQDSIKKDVILSRLSENFEIKISEEEIKNFAINDTYKQYISYGFPAEMIKYDLIVETVEQSLKDENTKHNIYNQITSLKIGDNLKDKVILEYKDINVEEFYKLA